MVRTDSNGDFSTYTLAVVANLDSNNPPAGFDPKLSSIDFSFKVECPADFDCAQPDACPPELRVRPEIDYLAKDYQGFRRLMLDRLSLLVPSWTERSAADLGVALVELLAYAADNLSYRQDAIANDLVGVQSVYLATWLEALRPVRGKLQAPLEVIYRDGKIQVFATFQKHRVNPNDVAKQIKQRATAAALRNWRGDLQKFSTIFLIASNAAQNAIGH